MSRSMERVAGMTGHQGNDRGAHGPVGDDRPHRDWLLWFLIALMLLLVALAVYRAAHPY